MATRDLTKVSPQIVLDMADLIEKVVIIERGLESVESRTLENQSQLETLGHSLSGRVCDIENRLGVAMSHMDIEESINTHTEHLHWKCDEARERIEELEKSNESTWNAIAILSKWGFIVAINTG